MKLQSSCALAVAVLICGLMVPLRAGQSPAAGEGPRVFDTGTRQRIRVVTVASGLVHPWSIAFLPDGRTMLVAERSGRLRILHDGVLDAQPIWSAPAPPAAPGDAGAAASPDRLHAVAVHPQFAQNHWVYVSHPKWGERGNTLAVSRGRLDGRRSPTCARSSSPTRGKPRATSPAACCSAPTARYTSRSATATGCAASAARITACG